jgi:CRP/FNR family transcriptional regulator, anaerobic regulatory protein
MALSLAYGSAATRGVAALHGGSHEPRTGRPPVGPALVFVRPPPADGIERLEQVGRTQKVHAGAIIVYEGDEVEDCIKVVGGAVRLSKMTVDGRRQVLDFRVPGEFLGVPGLDRHACTAEAIGEVTLRRYPRRQLEALVEDQPRLAKQLLAIAARELRAAQEQMLLLGRKHAHERVASFLLRMASLAPGMAGPGAAFELPMSRGDIADHLGLTVETVSRAFTALRRDGIIALPRPNQVVLLRPAALNELADGAVEERVAC